MNAIDELNRVAETTDWPALIAQALGDPPKPHKLVFRFLGWAWAFEAAHGVVPGKSDYPPAMNHFFKTLAFAHIPPKVHDWVNSFESKHGHLPKLEEVPEGLRELIPESGKPKGRPRCDTLRLRSAARAWEAELFRGSYETRREWIAIGKEAGLSSCFGFNQEDMSSDTPSSPALVKLSEETGKSEEYLRDIIYPRKK